MKLLALVLGLIYPLKIQSVVCTAANSCTITLNRNVTVLTYVYVKETSGAEIPLKLKPGTHNVSFASAQGVYASASLKP